MKGLWAIVLVLAGCEKKAPRYDGPLRIDFGDCAPDVAWVSGPRPLPLDKKLAEGFADGGSMVAEGGLLGQEAGEMQGGWGTIGTGRYGIGAGGFRPRRDDLPSVSIGQPNVQGDLDKAIIRRYIKRNIQKIQYCYEKELLSKPAIMGTVMTQFFIKPEGSVATATASGVDPAVSACVADVIKKIEFPKPKGGGGVQVNYPFTFRPGVKAGSGSASPPAPEGTFVNERKPPQKKVPVLAAYKPGGNNPLLPHRDAIEECLRGNTNPHGAVVVRLGAPSTIHGVDQGVADCMTDALKSLATTKSQSCSLSFGTMLAADLPAVEIGSDAIKYAGAPVATIAAVTDDKAPMFKIEALFDKASADAKRDHTAPVSMIGPLALRPLDTTPILVVAKVVTTLRAADANFVFAVDRGGTWQLLKPLALPVVPVPKGTGGAWNSRKVANADDERVRLSILVQQDQMWIGISRVNDFQKLSKGDFAKLKAELEQQKGTTQFSDRTDIEIAGELVTYGDVVKVIEVVTEAGFVDWSFVDVAGLSARPQK